MMTFYSLDLVNHTQEVQQTFSWKWLRGIKDFLIYYLKTYAKTW